MHYPLSHLKIQDVLPRCISILVGVRRDLLLYRCFIVLMVLLADKNKGFGFGEYSTHKEAEKAIAALHHSEHLGRKLLASWAGQPRASTDHRIRLDNSPLAGPVAQPLLNQAGTSSAPLNPGNSHAQSQPNIHQVPGNEALIDIGANLASHKFNHSTGALLSRAAHAGVSHIIITGTSVLASESAISLITKFDPRPHQERKHARVRLYSTVGVHPHDASSSLRQYPDYIDRLEKLILDHPGVVVSVGECGLDYDRMFSPKEDQKSVFRAQMDLAKSALSNY
jgi:RNA recognition motif-containing protein